VFWRRSGGTSSCKKALNESNWTLRRSGGSTMFGSFEKEILSFFFFAVFLFTIPSLLERFGVFFWDSSKTEQGSRLKPIVSF
jgi:hypothetical protein